MTNRKQFTPIKYPKTPHLPFSPEVHHDDIQLSFSQNNLFTQRRVIITEKLDGGNCQIMDNKVYARTTTKEATHSSFNAVKSMVAEKISWRTGNSALPPFLSLFGENMQGIHSIEYNGLDSYFYLFSVLSRNGKPTYSKNSNTTVHDNSSQELDYFLSWDDVVYLAKQIDIPTVPVLFDGIFNSMEEIEQWMQTQAQLPSSKCKLTKEVDSVTTPEGFVIRIADGFYASDFEKSVAKFVRKGHVQTKEDWSRTYQTATLMKTEHS